MSSLHELLQKADTCKLKKSSVWPQAKEEQTYVDRYFCTAFTYSSNALEGNTLTISETKTMLENGVSVANRPLKDCFETAGHSDAYYFMLTTARQQNLNITEEIIQSLHRLYYQKVDAKKAGIYRTGQISISDMENTIPAPDDVPHLMKHLADQIHFSQSTLHPVELAAMAHKRLLDIAPFMDGNGITARLLMNLILVHNGYGVVCIPPSLKNGYQKALSASRRLNDMEPFSKLIAECVIEAEHDYCRLLKQQI